MSNIKITRDGEKEDKEQWDKLHDDLKDSKKWKAAKDKDLEEALEAVAPLKKGRPKSEVETKGVFVKLPVELIDELKEEARHLNIGYQSYMKMALSEYLKKKKKRAGSSISK